MIQGYPAAMQYVRLDLVTAGPCYVVLQSTLKSYYTRTSGVQATSKLEEVPS